MCALPSFAEHWHSALKVDHNDGVQKLDTVLTFHVNRMSMINVSLGMQAC